jgi:hypothetical protein
MFTAMMEAIEEHRPPQGQPSLPFACECARMLVQPIISRMGRLRSHEAST